MNSKPPKCVSAEYTINGYDGTNKNLTGLWHLENIGADLAKSFVYQLPPEKLKKIRVGIMDTSLHFQRPKTQLGICKESIRSPSVSYSDFADMAHGHWVASMISGEFGVMELDGRIDSFIHSTWSGKQNLSEIFDSVTRGLKVLNSSVGASDPYDMKMGDPKKYRFLSIIEGLDKAGVIVVTSAGNEAKKKMELGYDKLKISAIVVGAIGPDGWRSNFSQNSRTKSIIFAPGDTLLADSLLDPIKRTGTSFASPIVAGIVGLALQILPELNRDIVEQMLWYTGFNGPKGDLDPWPPKIVNAYKFARTVYRLAALVEKKRPLSGQSIQEIVNKEIKKQEIFDFVAEAEGILQESKKVNTSDCSGLWKKINLLRKSFFLNPIKSTADQLSASYIDAGYVVNAEFFQQINKPISGL